MQIKLNISYFPNIQCKTKFTEERYTHTEIQTPDLNMKTFTTDQIHFNSSKNTNGCGFRI